MPSTLFQNTMQQNQSISLLQPVLPALVVASTEMAAKEFEEERKRNEQEIKLAESNINTSQVPGDLADIGLTHQHVLSELHTVVPGIKSAGTASSAELRRACIDKSTLIRIAAQKGLNVDALNKALEKKASDQKPQEKETIKTA